jgi:uncharacterized Tic20 family protein
MPQDSPEDIPYQGGAGRPGWPNADPFGGPPGQAGPAAQGQHGGYAAGQQGPPPGPQQYGPPPGGQYYGGQPPYGGQQYQGQQYQGQPYPGQQYAGQYQGPLVPAAGYQTRSDDGTWAMLSYLGSILFGLLAPLIVYLVKKDESPFVRFHGAQALNLAISFAAVSVGLWVVGTVIGAVTFGVGALLGFLLWAAAGIVYLVYAIMGAMAANRGEMNTMPTWLAWPMVH